MCLSDFSDQLNFTLKQYQISENSPLGRSVKNARAILQQHVSGFEAAHEALERIAGCFTPESIQQCPELSARIHSLLTSEEARINLALQAIFWRTQQQSTVPIPLLMLNFVPYQTDLSQPVPGAIPCTIDKQLVYIDRQTIVDFFNKNGLDVTAATDDQLRLLLEAVSNDIVKRTLTLERVQELIRRIVVGIHLFSIHPASIEPSFSVSQLIASYKSREWSDNIPITIGQEQVVVGGYLTPGATEEERVQIHEQEKEYLLQLVSANNQQFAEILSQIQQDDEGFVEKLNLQPKESFYVRADIHSDLASLMAQLEMHRMLGHVDENYHCKPGFHLVFLGDYTDRGANDIEVLTLLLTLRMLNPTSVHLIRGNHEEVATQANYSNESQWFIAHENELTSLYKSLPLGVCIGVPVPGAKPPYVYCTHGAFSPAEDLNPLYESEHSSMVMKEIPVMQERIYEGREPKLEEKQRKAFQELQKVPVLTSHARWSDIGEQSGPSPRGKGWVFTPEQIRAWGRYNNIRFLIRAHQHEFKEFLVTRQGKRAGEEKVIAMTLPVGTTGGGYASLLREPRQGVLWQVATRVADWKKELALSVGEKQNVSFVLQGKKCGVYEKFPAPFVEQRPEEYRQYPPSFEQIDVTSIQMEEG